MVEKLKQRITLKDKLYKYVKIKRKFDLNKKLFFYFTKLPKFDVLSYRFLSCLKLHSNEKLKIKYTKLNIKEVKSHLKAPQPAIFSLRHNLKLR